MKRTFPAPYSAQINVEYAMTQPTYTVVQAAHMLWGGGAFRSHVPLSRNRTADGYIEVDAVRGDTIGSVAAGRCCYIVEKGEARNEISTPDTKFR